MKRKQTPESIHLNITQNVTSSVATEVITIVSDTLASRNFSEASARQAATLVVENIQEAQGKVQWDLVIDSKQVKQNNTGSSKGVAIKLDAPSSDPNDGLQIQLQHTHLHSPVKALSNTGIVAFQPNTAIQDKSKLLMEDNTQIALSNTQSETSKAQRVIDHIRKFEFGGDGIQILQHDTHTPTYLPTYPHLYTYTHIFTYNLI